MLAAMSAVTRGSETTGTAAQPVERLHSIGDAYHVIATGGGRRILCARCEHDFGDAGEDPKLGALVAEREITAASPLNAGGAVEELVLREFYCPGCGAMVTANVQRAGDPILIEMRLA